MGLKLKEPISGSIHILGSIFAVIAGYLLLSESMDPFKPWHIAGFSVFCSGIFLLYTASTLYHWLPVSKKAESVLQKLDQSMIYVLIASTYTPICLIPLRGVWGWSIFGVVWGLALFGILLRIFYRGLPNWFSTTLYLFMGWMSVIAIWPMIQTLQTGALIWIFIGGLFYSIGVVVYSLNKPNPIPNIFGAHEIWHIFVLCGTLSHFWVMYNYVTLFD